MKVSRRFLILRRSTFRVPSSVLDFPALCLLAAVCSRGGAGSGSKSPDLILFGAVAENPRAKMPGVFCSYTK